MNESVIKSSEQNQICANLLLLSGIELRRCYLQLCVCVSLLIITVLIFFIINFFEIWCLCRACASINRTAAFECSKQIQQKWLAIVNISKKQPSPFPVMSISMVCVSVNCCLFHFFPTISTLVGVIHSIVFSRSGTTFYNIHISIGNVYWTVRHRYNEFVELHAKLVNGQSIGRDLLPPKKVN